ncbi:DUF1648 domain-containing protein [Streptococcus oricebi]|uniref:DUF1648 domain-containing protein n=1 Tax=Streptococcus oricebi TaxID=1547447 RepID=A0ABS5B3B2_9STRE|nr:DUF1648 domain-containing protein [Streptococcus oricebi]MBP2623310.1 hypothetical protein [Streptococcus oricebi]
MKNKKKLRELGLTFLVIWLPVLYGLSVYQDLPQNIRIHFGWSTAQPFEYMDKSLFIWALPLFLTLVQGFVYWTTTYKKISKSSFEHFILWIVPVVQAVIYSSVLFKALNASFDIMKPTLILTGLILVISGNYLPKKVLEEEKPAPRLLAYSMVLVGFLCLLAGFFLSS